MKRTQEANEHLIKTCSLSPFLLASGCLSAADAPFRRSSLTLEPDEETAAAAAANTKLIYIYILDIVACELSSDVGQLRGRRFPRPTIVIYGL